MAKLIMPDGNVLEVRPQSTVFTNIELDNLVTPGESGFLQAIPLGEGKWMWIHEEGKFRNLPVNPTATVVAQGHIHRGELIVGNALVTDNEEVD